MTAKFQCFIRILGFMHRNDDYNRALQKHFYLWAVLY